MTRLLVDTHALLWWLTDDAALPAKARASIADARNDALVSVAAAWEIAIKRSLGKLTAPDDLPARVEAQGFAWLSIGPTHAWRVRDLPMHHRDPFDRLMIAQALEEDLVVITADAEFADYGARVLW